VRILKRRPPTPPKFGPRSYINIFPRIGPSHTHSDRLTTARERCLTARDAACDPDMRLYWTHCVRHFEIQLGVT
jgi:hypothetical protein